MFSLLVAFLVLHFATQECVSVGVGAVVYSKHYLLSQISRARVGRVNATCKQLKPAQLLFLSQFEAISVSTLFPLLPSS